MATTVKEYDDWASKSGLNLKITIVVGYLSNSKFSQSLSVRNAKVTLSPLLSEAVGE